MKLKVKLFILLFFVFNTSLNASLSVTNTTPNINGGEGSIGNFNIIATVINTSDLDLGSSFSFTLPNSLPDMSMDDIDDGKIFVSLKVFDVNKTAYKSFPGLRFNVSDRNVSVTITSILYALESDKDGVNKKVSFSKGDYMQFILSASSDIRNIANVRYKDSSSIIFTSSDINIINKSNTISTPSKLITINNPSVILTKSGLGATNNIKLKFKVLGGIVANTRLEIEFPQKFEIDNLANFSNNIYINDTPINKKNYINNQKLSFIVENAISSEDIELLILGNHIKNPIAYSDDPFSLSLFLRGDDYKALYSGSQPRIDQVYYDDKELNEKYSVGDRIIIQFFKKILVSSFTKKNYISFKEDRNGSTFGYLYGLSAIDSDGLYASSFAITLGNDFNLSEGLDVIINKTAIVGENGVRATDDLSFAIPSYYQSYASNTIEGQYDKLYAKNDIDMLHTPLNNSTPTYASVSSLKVRDEDNSASYSAGDSLSITFSSRVEAIKILNKSSIHIPFSDTSFGDGFSIELNEARVLRENFYSKYKIRLGSNPSIKPNSQFSFLKDMVISKDSSNALSDVVFSGFPMLTRPNQSSQDVDFEDNDKNGAYSSGDRLILSFNQNIESLDVKKIKVNNSKNLDISFISTKTSSNGYSSQYSIKLGDQTNISKGDVISIPKSSIVNMHGVKAGSSKQFMKFNIIDIVIPKIDDVLFNYGNMQALIKVSAMVYESNSSSIEDNILIFANGTKQSLKEWGVKYTITDLSSGSKNILIDFEDDFLTKLGSNVFDFIIKDKTFKSAYNITNDRFAKTFYRPTRLVGLIPEAWNLVAIQDNGTDTNIANILKTGKVSKIWVFDDGEWYLSDKNIQRGDGFWVVPNAGVKGIENIEGIQAIDSDFKSSKLLNKILKHNSQSSIPLGSSVTDCDDITDKLLISDVLYNNTEDKNVTVFLFDAENSKWIKNKDILPCEGFLVSITGTL